MRLLVSALALILFVSCSSDNKTFTPPETTGLAFAESEFDFATTYSGLRSNIQESELLITGEFDFKYHAETNGKRSRETKMILFSNPSLEAPLIKDNPEIGLEFPARLVTMLDRDKFVLVAYNNTEYLSRAYDLNDLAAVQNMEAFLAQVVSKSTGNMTMKTNTITLGNSALNIPSRKSFNEVYNALRNTIVDAPEMNLIAEVDHKQHAKTVGVEMRANKVLIFTIGELEAGLLDRNQLTAVDLPVRILVWEDEEGKTQISWQFLDTLATRHQVDSSVGQLESVKSSILTMVVEAAN